MLRRQVQLSSGSSVIHCYLLLILTHCCSIVFQVERLSLHLPSTAVKSEPTMSSQPVTWLTAGIHDAGGVRTPCQPVVDVHRSSDTFCTLLLSALHRPINFFCIITPLRKFQDSSFHSCDSLAQRPQQVPWCTQATQCGFGYPIVCSSWRGCMPRNRVGSGMRMSSGMMLI